MIFVVVALPVVVLAGLVGLYRWARRLQFPPPVSSHWLDEHVRDRRDPRGSGQ